MMSVQSNKRRKLLFAACFFSLFMGYLFWCGNGWCSPACTVRSYDNQQYRNQGNVFTPEQTIYLYVLVQGVEPGQHNLVIDWLDPTGQLQEQTLDSFTADTAGIYQRMFALKLNKLGKVSRMVTGVTYPDRFFGQWLCRFFLDGAKLKEYSFEIR